MSIIRAEGPPKVWRLKKERLKFMGQECGSCGEKIFPPKAVCPNCGDRIDETKNSEKNSIRSNWSNQNLKESHPAEMLETENE